MDAAPENLRRNCHPSCVQKPELRCAECADWLAAADRIEELEAALKRCVEMPGPTYPIEGR